MALGQNMAVVAAKEHERRKGLAGKAAEYGVIDRNKEHRRNAEYCQRMANWTLSVARA